MDRKPSRKSCQCLYCRCFFAPDPRQNGRRHVTCGRPGCRRLYKNEWQRNRYADCAAFRDAVITRVAAWRRTHPDYWHCAALLTTLLSLAIPRPVALELVRLTETVRILELTVTGLIPLLPIGPAIVEARRRFSPARDRAYPTLPP